MIRYKIVKTNADFFRYVTYLYKIDAGREETIDLSVAFTKWGARKNVKKLYKEHLKQDIIVEDKEVLV